MEYSNEEIYFIQSKKPEYKTKPVPSLDAVIVEFLKKYEVYVQPISSGTRNTGESAVAGAITGMAGADVGGDAFMVAGQNKQIKVQEWTQWKQWALDHKDFEPFKVEKINKAKEHNEEINKKLKDPVIQKQLEPVLEDFKNQQRYNAKLNLIVLVGFPLILFVGIFIAGFFQDKNNDSSFNNQTIRKEKITNFIL